jgi:hypothetical protein
MPFDKGSYVFKRWNNGARSWSVSHRKCIDVLPEPNQGFLINPILLAGGCELLKSPAQLQPISLF